MIWQSYGLYFISWCQKFLIHFMTLMNGLTYRSSRLFRKTFQSVRKFLRSCIQCWDHSSYADWKKTYKLNFQANPRRSFVVQWVVVRNIYTMKWYGTKTSGPKVNSQQAVWWMFWWGWKRSAIIPTCSNPELKRVPWIGFPWLLWLRTTCS